MARCRRQRSPWHLRPLGYRVGARPAVESSRGPSFMALHELLDEIAGRVDEHSDTMAERVVQVWRTCQILPHGNRRGRRGGRRRYCRHMTEVSRAVDKDLWFIAAH